MTTDVEERFAPGRSIEGDSGEEDEWESGSEQEEVLDLIERQNAKESAIIIDWDAILGSLDTDLPKIPARPVIEQINPPPYAMPRVKFGKLMPKPEDEEGGKKKKKAPKKEVKIARVQNCL